MHPASLVRSIRSEAGLSLRALAEAAGVATSTVHRIEQGQLDPSTDTLNRLAEAAGVQLVVETRPDHARSIVGLGRSIADDLARDDHTTPVRKAAELVHQFDAADDTRRTRMIAGEPRPLDDPRWDSFLAALAEWLAVRHRLPTPGWANRSGRYLRHGWWVTPMTSMRAWEYAGSPASFQLHGVYLHRESLTNI